MIPTTILPAGAVQHVVRLDGWQWTDPELEQWTRQQCPGALERRHREFAAGRVCAAHVIHALTGTTVPPQHIGRTTSGAPDWPAGVVGSLAHSRQMAGAVARRGTEALGIGLDIEPVMTADRARTVARRVGSRDELAALQQSAGLTYAAAVTLTFCAKEALFKCVHPLVGTMFHLSDARVETATVRDQTSRDRSAWTGEIALRLLVDLSSEMHVGRLFTVAIALDDEVGYAVVSVDR